MPGNTKLQSFPSSWANRRRKGVSQMGLLAPKSVSIEMRKERSQSFHSMFSACFKKSVRLRSSVGNSAVWMQTFPEPHLGYIEPPSYSSLALESTQVSSGPSKCLESSPDDSYNQPGVTAAYLQLPGPGASDIGVRAAPALVAC